MDSFIEIDGSLHQGGGQMIRSSLALGTILQKQFSMHSLRNNRPNPGINNQLRSVFSAFTEKIPKVGDTQVYIYPSFTSPKVIKASSAASCTLILQCLVPTCVGLGYTKSIKVEGGTDVAKSPCMQSLRLGLMPLLEKMGIILTIQDMKKGYYPTGGGYVVVKVDTKDNFICPVEYVNFSPPQKVVITYYVKSDKLPPRGKQFNREVRALLDQHFPQQKIKYDLKVERVFRTKKQDYGIGCMAYGNNCVWDVGTVGQPIREQTIIQRLQSYCQKRVCLDQHHQDQLLLLASLASGISKFRVGQQLSLHTQSLLYVIKQFIPQFQYKHEAGILEIHGIGWKIKKEEEMKQQQNDDQ